MVRAPSRSDQRTCHGAGAPGDVRKPVHRFGTVNVFRDRGTQHEERPERRHERNAEREHRCPYPRAFAYRDPALTKVAEHRACDCFVATLACMNAQHQGGRDGECQRIETKRGGPADTEHESRCQRGAGECGNLGTHTAECLRRLNVLFGNGLRYEP